MENKKICFTCFREFPESNMKKYFGGQISNMCMYCDDIIGKGAGYADEIKAEKERAAWFADASDRKQKLIKEGKLKK